MKKVLKIIGIVALVIVGAILIWKIVLPFISFVLQHIAEFLKTIF